MLSERMRFQMEIRRATAADIEGIDKLLYQVNMVQTTVQNFQSTVCNWLRNKNFVSHTVWVKNNSVTCSYKLLKLKVEHLVSTLWFFWNVVLTTLFTVSVLQLLVVKHVNS